MEIRVEAPLDGRPHRVSVAGLDAPLRAALAGAGPAALARALAVYTGDRVPGPEMPAVTGAHEVDEAGLHFRPRFPFVPALRYTARFSFGGLSMERVFEVAAPRGGEPPRVLAVHPSGATLPENALRLYVQFSRPMTARGVQRHVRLRDEDGAEVPLAFVEVEDGLWDPSQTRLTLFFHPGRVKRGVAPGERLGPVLVAGRSYRLEVDAALTDAGGVPLGQVFEHRFRATGADRASPRLAEVRLRLPSSPRGALAAALPEPLDHGLLQRWIWVEDADGATVTGTAEVTDGETRWSFRPAEPWAGGRYALRLRSALEDRAGNRFDRLFDREAEGPSMRSDGDAVLGVPFEIAWP